MTRRITFRMALILTLLLPLQICSEELRLHIDGNGDAVAKGAPIVLTGNTTISELIVDDGKRVIVSESTLILTGNITVKDDGQLLITQSRLQLSIRGEKAYNVSIHDSGTIVMEGSVLESLSETSTITLAENATMTMANSEITGFNQLLSLDNSSFTAQGSTLNLGRVLLDGKSATITGSFMPQGELSINATTTEILEFKGDAVSMNVSTSSLKGLNCNTLNLNSTDLMYLNNTRSGTAVLCSNEEVIVTDSSFDSLTFLSPGIATNVTVTVEGAEARAGGPIFAGCNATVLRYWYLTVNATDLVGTGIPAQITVTDYMNKTAAVEEADVNGLYVRAFPAEIVNCTRTIFIGNYRIRARYLEYGTENRPVVLDGNKYVWARFLESVPVVTTTKLSLSTLKIRAGDKVRFEGSIDSGKANEFVQVSAIGPGDSRIEKAFETDANGVFKGEYTIQTIGEWYIYADWFGGASQGISTKSQAFVVTVEPRPPITLLLIRVLPIVFVVLGVLIGVAFLALGRRKRVKI